MLRLSVLLFSILVLASCGRERIDEHEDFIGEWTGSDSRFRSYLITIDDDGDCYYYRQGIGYVERSGRFWVSKSGETVKIAGKKFDLIEYPYEEEPGVKRMRIDDIDLVLLN